MYINVVLKITFQNNLNYASTSNIRKLIKFYNLGDKTFETDFSAYHLSALGPPTETIGHTCLVLRLRLGSNAGRHENISFSIPEKSLGFTIEIDSKYRTEN